MRLFDVGVHIRELDEIIVEAQNYNAMFGKDFVDMVGLAFYFGQLRGRGKLPPNGPEFFAKAEMRVIDGYINTAKRSLKKNDRIIWYLRYAKAWYIHRAIMEMQSARDHWTEYKGLFDDPEGMKNFIKNAFAYIDKERKKLAKKNISVDHTISDPDRLLRGLEHFYSLGIQGIDETVLDNQEEFTLMNQFQLAEDDWKNTRKKYVPLYNSGKEIVRINKDLAWYDLEKASCEIEGNAMGHCGNVPMGNSPNHTILSLRKYLKNDSGEWLRPVATFILDKRDGMLGEMKGIGNEKPDVAKYGDAIFKLLNEYKPIKGIVGGGYKPEANFAVTDLPPADVKKLIAKKPDLISLPERLGMFGFDDVIYKKLNDDLKMPIEEWRGKKWYFFLALDLKGLAADIGTGDFRKAVKLLTGEQHFNADVVSNIKGLTKALYPDTIEVIKKYIKNNHPDIWDQSNGDWYTALHTMSLENKEIGLEDVEGEYDDAYDVGMRDYAADAIETALDKVYAISRQEKSDRRFVYDIKWDHKKLLQDATFKIMVDLEESYKNGAMQVPKWATSDADFKVPLHHVKLQFIDVDNHKMQDAAYEFVYEEFNGRIRGLFK